MTDHDTLHGSKPLTVWSGLREQKNIDDEGGDISLKSL